MNNLNFRFRKAIDDMVFVNHYLATELCKLGYPVVCQDIPTAGVGWDPEKKKIIFFFNPTFAKKLNDEEFCFVVAHECIHLLNSHVFLLYNETQKMKKLQKSQSQIENYKKRMNIAMDCVVNDSLINLYDLPKLLTEEEEISGKCKIWYGKETIGVHCHDMTAQDVYNLLPDELLKTVENHDNWNSFYNPDGSINRDFVDTFKNFIEKNIQNSALSDDEADKIDEMKKNMQQCNDVYAAKAGKDITGTKRPIDGISRETLNWNKILYKFVDKKRGNDDWTKTNRKLTHVYPDVILPVYKYVDREKIFCAIDASPSISPQALKLFVSVLKNTPKHFEIDAISFATQCFSYNVRGNESPQGGQGTNFGIIEEYIQNNFKVYPKVVFVLTDGEGSIVNPQYPDRWGWLLYGSCATNYCKDMKHYNISDLLEKNAKI